MKAIKFFARASILGLLGIAFVLLTLSGVGTALIAIVNEPWTLVKSLTGGIMVLCGFFCLFMFGCLVELLIKGSLPWDKP